MVFRGSIRFCLGLRSETYVSGSLIDSAGAKTLAIFSSTFKKSTSLNRWFKPFRNEEILLDEVRCSDQVILAGRYYLNCHAYECRELYICVRISEKQQSSK